MGLVSAPKPEEPTPSPVPAPTAERPAYSREDVARKLEQDASFSALLREVERKLFPGYVLVKAAVTYDENNVPSMSDDAWFVIRNTRGVTGFVGPESKATPLSEDEVLKLGVEKKSIEVEYQVGDTVRITDERLEGFSGTVTKIDMDNETVTVSVSAFFGKETSVELELDQVEL